MKHVYFVQHSYELENGQDVIKEIGIYSTRKIANEAVKKFRNFSAFKDYPKGFYIDKYELGENHWVSGFIAHIESDGVGYCLPPFLLDQKKE